MNVTVLGASGFIGSHLLAALQRDGHTCAGVSRGDDVKGKHLHHAIFCIGLTADFRERPLDTAEAHVTLVEQMLRDCTFDSFLYLSSTRVYGSSSQPAKEEDALTVQPQNPDHLYNLTKLTGEALTLSAGGRVARLSNVYGEGDQSENFLASIIRDAVRDGHVHVRTDRASEKNYVDIQDVVRLLPEIAFNGKQKMYNVAGGENVQIGDILDALSRATGCTTDVESGAPLIRQAPISIARVQEEFAFVPRKLLDEGGIDRLVASYQGR